MKIIIDSNALAYAAYYTVGDLSLDDVPTGVVYGFLRKVLSIAKNFNSNDFIFCWDSKKSFRKLLYPEYKAKRHKDKDPIELARMKKAFSQFDVLRSEVLPELGFNNVFRKTGLESDDLIAILCRDIENEHIVIATTDQDLYQCLSRSETHKFVVMYNLKTKKNYTKEMFEKEYGIGVEEWANVKAIAGCKSDNVEGVKGVGEKTAIKYLNRELKQGKMLEAIRNNTDITERNKKLVTLPFKTKNKVELELQENSFSKEKFIDVFDYWKFKSFLKQDALQQWTDLFVR